ncbi:alpha/beta fold family hydrolase [Trichoderma parareesei]|uniref:Alpha/beta fold family hydrolase n=1 Tax=Trichoderma parareesei TaxID=858221 RepID=A0A2H2ZHZ8_TRIPA|nr:alpha/beta fold family hydrolase [Trichoderma parareesei]
MSEELFVTLPSGCRICYQVFGSPLDPAILLISGHSGAMTQKTDGLVRLLSPPNQPYFVIRFDHRDTGRSTSFARPPDGSPVYTLGEMVDDIVGLIRHLELSAVHLVGTSLGGTLAWQTAARLPDIVKSLALVLTSPVGRQQLPSDKLPQVHLDGQWLIAEAYTVPDDSEDDEAWIQSYMQLDLALATQSPTEEERAESRRESEITYYREKESGTMWTKYNHSDASGVRWPRELLKQITCPTVVIHAAKDQIFPMKHAEALRDDVKGATLVILEDCGHEIPHRVRQRMVDAIIQNVRKGE